MSSSLITRRYSLIISLLLFVGILSRISYDYFQVEDLIESEVTRLHKQIDTLLQNHIKQINIKYETISKNYQHNQKFIELVKSRDREALYSKLQYDYKSMRSLDSHLYVMHIFDTNNTTILRMHKPEAFNDNLTDIRPMIKDINRNKLSVQGFEVGKNGITYRVSTPIITIRGSHVGVLEFGVKPSYFIDEINSIVGVQAQLIVKTESLKSLEIKEKKEQLGVYEIIKSSPIFTEINPQIDLTQKYQILKVDKKTYVVFNNFSLKSYHNQDEAKIIFTKDISSVVRKYQESLFMIYGINSSIVLVVIIIFFIGMRKTKHLQVSLRELNATLEDKIRQRTEEQNTLLTLFDKGDSVLFKWRCDKKWSVEFASLGVTELLGYPLVDIMSSKVTYSSCIHKDDIQRVIREVKEASLSGDDYFKHEPYRVITKDGDIKWVFDYTAIVRDDSGEITHYIGHINDVTEQKNMQKQLLIQSRMAQMGEMISMIAHQWRQPLGTISSTSIDLNMKLELELFDSETKSGRAEMESYLKKSLFQIDTMVQSLTTTIDDFRNFYKQDKVKTVEAAEISVSKAYKIIESTLKSNNIEVSQLYLSNTELTLYPNELMQVVLNILQNANDNFVSKKIQNPTLSIKIFDIKNSVVIEICDNGGGIQEEILDKIFDPYFSTKHEKNGTGLGLYMSKIIIQEHHKGVLNAKNLDKEVCFTIELPSGGLR